MALEKVLALDATGIIEKTIDTGGGGGGGGAPLTDPQFTAYVGIGTPANADYALNIIKDLTYQGTFGSGFDSSEAGIMLRTNVPAQTPGAGSPFTSGITNYKVVQLQAGANYSFNAGISNVMTSTVDGLRNDYRDYLTGVYNRVIAAGTDAVNTAVGGLTGIQNNVLTTGANQVISSMTAMIAAAALSSSNSATTLTGITAGAQCPAGATAGTITGINIGLIAAGTYTNCWSLYSNNNAGTMYHAGKVALGGAARVPTTQLDVEGYITATSPPGGDNTTKVATTQYVQSELAAAGIISDGVNESNFCDLAMDGTTIINMFKEYVYRPTIGVAKLLTVGQQSAATGLLQHGASGSSANTSGTGASNIFVVGEISQSTGTTATGYSRMEHKLEAGTTVPAHSFYALPVPNNSVNSKMAASCSHYISALSDATNTFTSIVTLLGTGPATNAAIAVTDSGFMLSYMHSVNAGNYVINYRGADGTLKTVNTTVAPGVGLANAKRIVAKAHRTAANTATVTINIGGTVYTITDSAFNAASIYCNTFIGGRIVKTAGTTARTQGIRHASVARNFT